MKKPALFVLCILLSVVHSSLAQGIVGNWKRTSELVVRADGTQSDSHQKLVKMKPCYATLVFSFTADGKMDHYL